MIMIFIVKQHIIFLNLILVDVILMISNPKNERYDIITHINNIMEEYNLHMIIDDGNLFNIEYDFYWIFDFNENLFILET